MSAVPTDDNDEMDEQQLEAQHGKYRWTEYRDVSTAARVIEHAPQCSGHSLTESSARSHHDAASANQEQQQPLLDSHQDQHQGRQQRRKHPSEAHDSMEFTAIPSYLKFDLLQGLRRSQSEGPGPQYHHSSRDPVHGAGAATETGLMAAWVHGRRRHVTEQQRPEHWLISAPASAAGSVLAVETRAPTVHERQQAQQQPQQNSSSSSSSVVQQQQQSNSRRSTAEFNWPAGKPSRKMPESLDSLLHFTSNEVPAVETSSQQKHHHQMESSIQNKHTSNEDQQQQNDQEQPRARRWVLSHQTLFRDYVDRWRYKTEYKKKYRPFSIYQYVDGRFQKSSSAADKIDSHDPKDPWYTEVVELRKKAGEYKYRGLGGEMMPEHMADLYAKQFDVWEQVSRRSSLSALALAAISPRATPEKENKSALSSASSSSGERKARGGSPAKTLPLGNHQAARPGHAQLVLISTRRANNKPAEERPRRDVSQQRSYSAGGSKARSKSVKPSSKSPATISSVSSPASSIQTTSNAPTGRSSMGNHANNQRPSARSASVGPERRMPTTARNASASSGAPVTRATPVKTPRSAHNNNEIKDNGEVKVAKKKDEDKGEAAPTVEVQEVAESEMPALIKAFPEPTRVKSPEQLVVRSPDPVNWTVPLDTGKTFTVTQNIVASRPHSELKVTMTVRPAAHPVAVIKPQQQQPAATTELKDEIIEAKEEAKHEVSDNRASSPTTSSAPTVASSLSAPENTEEDELNHANEANVADVPDEPVITKEPETVNKISPVTQHPLLTPDESLLATLATEESGIREISNPAEPVARPVAEVKMDEPMITEEKSQTPVKSVDLHRIDVASSDPLNATVALTKPKEEPLVRPVGPVIVPGTTLRRLEDPTPVLFSRPGTLGSLTGQPFAAAPAPVAPKGPRYRVLEAPGLVNEPVHPVHQHVESSHSMLPTSSPYKVLEAPASPPKIVPTLAGSPSSSPLSSSRSLASDVLEKARTRFDRFWTKKDSDK